MMTRKDVVQRARALTGRRFRPQGRDPETGLDCVGLVMQGFAIRSELVRRDYHLRGSHRLEMEKELSRFFVPVACAGAGDVVLCDVASNQIHLAIHCGDSFVHADAQLRLVVETPGEPRWPVLAAFRHRDLIQE